MIRYDMVDLNDYMKLNSNAIVDLVNKKYVPAEMTKEPTFEALAEILQGIFIFRYGSEIGTRDQAHNILAMAIIYSMWCGWLSQTKTNRGEYTQELADRFKKLIVDAFDIGQNYSNDQP
jgi:hypothetical protein